MKKQESKSFEASLAALEKIVRELEGGDLPLEQSLKLFEEGVRLSRECQERLTAAERRIEVLMRDASGQPGTVPFESAETSEDAGEDDDEDGL